MPTLIGDLVEDVLRDVDSLTPGMLADHLHAEHRFEVITPEEDQRLTGIGLEQACRPDGGQATTRGLVISPLASIR